MKKGTGRVVLIIMLLNFLPAMVFAWPVPDTGQTTCYDDVGNVIRCPSPGQPFYGQDGNYTINPPSYTKLDAAGNDLLDNAPSWVMVRDNVTGLIWENKTDDGTIHDKDNAYTWYDSNPATNGGDAGIPGDGTDTEDFIKALNDANYGGHNDWRMPTINELASIVNYSSHKPGPRNFAASFTNTQSAWYWSSITSVYYTDKVWMASYACGDTAGGVADFETKAYHTFARAVRGEQTISHFVDNGNGTVTDINTNLTWQKNTVLYNSWEQALAYCENSEFRGYTDWRLPTINELRSLVDYSRYPCIDATYFPNTPYYWFWTSTTDTCNAGANEVYSIPFDNGNDAGIDKRFDAYVRPVRSGTSSPPPPPPTSPKLYGLFIGQNGAKNLRGDLTAEMVSKNFANLKNVVWNKLITDKYGGIAQWQISSAINDIKNKIRPGDIFVFYICGHGAESLLFGYDETTRTIGDEYIFIGGFFGPFAFTDDELTSLLSEMNNIDKWILVDSCQSGGFWGNNYSGDQGDLEKLRKIGMIASAEETTSMYYNIDVDGIAWFGKALSDSWLKTNGYLQADSNQNGILTFDELSSWLENSNNYNGYYNGKPVNFLDGIVVREGALGDYVFMTEDLFTPESHKTDDFIGSIPTDLPEDPSAKANGPYTGEIDTTVALDANGSLSPNGDIILYEWDWDSDGVYDENTTSPVITHTWHEFYDGSVSLRVTDTDGFTDVDSAFVKIIETIPPEITLAVSPKILWPPKNKMVLITPFITASDNSGVDPIVILTSITMNEGDQTYTHEYNQDVKIGDGKTGKDIYVDDNGKIYLRAHRGRHGTNRIYTITYTATDKFGNSASASDTVTVPAKGEKK